VDKNYPGGAFRVCKDEWTCDELFERDLIRSSVDFFHDYGTRKIAEEEMVMPKVISVRSLVPVVKKEEAVEMPVLVPEGQKVMKKKLENVEEKPKENSPPPPLLTPVAKKDVEEEITFVYNEVDYWGKRKSAARKLAEKNNNKSVLGLDKNEGRLRF